MNIRSYLLSGSLWVMAGKVITAISMMGLYVIVTRFFPPDAAGTYFLALNVAVFFSFIAQLGIGYTVVRVVSESRGRGNESVIYEFIKKCLIIFFLGCLVVAIFYFFLHKLFLGDVLFSESNVYLGLLIAAWLILLAIQFNLGEFFRAFRLINLSALFSGVVSSLLSLILIFCFVLIVSETYPVYPIFYCVIIALAVNAALGLIVFLKHIKKFNFLSKNKNEYDSKKILTQSIPYMVSLLAFFITAQSDIWLAGLFLDKSEVAVYASAARIVLLTNLLLVVVESVISPLIAEMNSKGETQQLELLLRKTATIVFFPASIVFLGFVLLGDDILALLYGEFYREGYYSLLILVVAQMIIVVTGSCGPVLLMTGYQKVVMHIAIITAILTITIGAVLVQWIGKEGAALAVLVSFMVQQLLRIIYIRKYLGVTTMVDMTLIPSILRSFSQLKRSGFKI